MNTGLIHLYLGDGKGKTTAAVGLAARAAGCGRRVVFAQFLKGSPTGEIDSLESLGVRVIRSDKSMGFYRYMDDEQKKTCHEEQLRLLEEIQKAVLSEAAIDMLILDEALDAMALGLLDEDGLRDFTKQKPESLEIIFTGRSAPGCLMERADYITEMKKIKHPYDRGVTAREAIEY